MFYTCSRHLQVIVIVRTEYTAHASRPCQVILIAISQSSQITSSEDLYPFAAQLLSDHDLDILIQLEADGGCQLVSPS